MPFSTEQLAPLFAIFALISGIVAFAANLFGISSSVKSLLSRDSTVSAMKDVDPEARSQLSTAVGAGMIAIAGSEVIKHISSAVTDADHLADLAPTDVADSMGTELTDLTDLL